MNADALIGSWTLRRHDGANLLIGGATVTPIEEGVLLYVESLQTSDPRGGKHEAYRHYRYEFATDRLKIRHASGPQTGMLFLDMPLSRAGDIWTATGDHLCGADRYHAHLRFDLPHRWHSVVTATGPRKDFVLRTEYEANEPRGLDLGADHRCDRTEGGHDFVRGVGLDAPERTRASGLRGG